MDGPFYFCSRKVDVYDRGQPIAAGAREAYDVGAVQSKMKNDKCKVPKADLTTGC